MVLIGFCPPRGVRRVLSEFWAGWQPWAPRPHTSGLCSVPFLSAVTIAELNTQTLPCQPCSSEIIHPGRDWGWIFINSPVHLAKF